MAVAAALVVGLVAFANGKVRLNPALRGYFALAWVWILVGTLGSMSAYDSVGAIKELLNVILGLGVVAVVAGLVGYDTRMATGVWRAWVAAYLVTGLVAVWELKTGQHLYGTFMEQTPDYVLVMTWAMSTFANPNNYAAFLLLCFPFLLQSYASTKQLGIKVFAGLLVASLPLLMTFTGSRGGLFGLFLEILVLAGMRRGLTGVGLALGGSIAVVGVGLFLLSAADLGESSLMIVGKVTFIRESMLEGGSLNQRLYLIGNGLAMLLNTWGWGVGPHGFERAVLGSDMPYRIEIPNPHNFWIEVASQYGIVVFAMLAYWLWTLVRIHLDQIRFARVNRLDASFSKTALVGCVGYVFATMENSSYIPQPTNWLFLGTLLALTNVTYAGGASPVRRTMRERLQSGRPSQPVATFRSAS